MKVIVVIRPGNAEKTVELEEGARIIDALRAAEIPPDITICMMNGRPVPVDTTLRDGERIEAVRTFSGG